MKRKISLVLTLLLAAVLLAGCGGGSTNNGNVDTPGNEEAGAVKLGLGSVSSIAKSKDYVAAEGDKAEVLAVSQVDTIIAAASFDKNGKVVSVTIDTAQTRVNFDADLKVTNRDEALKTKVEKGDEYGMINASSIGKEWYEQIAELEKWMVGKTIAEIKAMKLTDDVTAEADLASLVTIGVADYIAAVEKAWTNASDVENAAKLGLGHLISINKSKDYVAAEGDKAEVLPVAQVDTIMSATAFDADGKVVGTIIDTAQIRVQLDAEGKVTTDKTAELKTKIEKGDEYGMINASSIGKEWYEQIDELGSWMVGKTIAEIKAMELSEDVTAEADLTSKVTIGVTDYLAVVEEAYTNAK